MGRRGPKPTPKNILAMRGSWRANLAADTLDAPNDRPRCPNWLSKEAKKQWRQLVKELEKLGLLSSVDWRAMARYCHVWADWCELEQWIAEHGRVCPVKDKDGNTTRLAAWPQTKLAADRLQQLSRLEAEFGLTPSSRSRITTPKKKADEDPVEAFRKAKTWQVS